MDDIVYSGIESRRLCRRSESGDLIMNQRVSIPKIELAAFCQARGILRLAIFGSALWNDFGPSSDIDILVKFAPGRTPGLLGMAGMEIELSVLFGGRKVDL